MMRIDPASAEFERLSREQQATILRRHFNWSVSSLMEEFSVTKKTMLCWTDPAFKAREKERQQAYRRSEQGKLAAQDRERRYRASGRRSFVRSRMDAIA